MRLITYITSSALTALLGACAGNPVYFYETEKIAFTVEARPDVSQPVQGSLGLKQRIVLITPRKIDDDVSLPTDTNSGIKTGDTTKGTKIKSGDSVSVLSTFRFSKTPSTNALVGVGAFLIQSALITGDAVECAVPGSHDNGCVQDTGATPTKAGTASTSGATASTAGDETKDSRAALPKEPAPAREKAASGSKSDLPVDNPKDDASSNSIMGIAKVISQKRASLSMETVDSLIDQARKNNKLIELLNAVAEQYPKINKADLKSKFGIDEKAYSPKIHDALRKKFEIE